MLGASQRTPVQAWRFLLVCCSAILLNLVVPLPVHQNVAPVLIDRLLVCLGLVITTALVVRNQELERQRIAIEVQLGQANLRGDVIATLAHDIKTPVLGTLASLSLLEGCIPGISLNPGILNQRAAKACGEKDFFGVMRFLLL
jgi:two-component system NarL family sensor kinase